MIQIHPKIRECFEIVSGNLYKNCVKSKVRDLRPRRLPFSKGLTIKQMTKEKVY
jgi:hypothetical protein